MAQAMKPLEVLRTFRRHDFTLGDFLDSRVETAPDRACIQFEGSSLTYAEFAGQVHRTAAMFGERGIGPGDRVGVISTNHPSTAVLLFAAARLGAVLVPVNPDSSPAQVRYVFDHTDVAGIVAGPAALHLLHEAIAGQDRQRWVLLNEPAPGVDHETLTDAVARTGDGADVPNAGTAESTCLVIYTSGTTGYPKGVMHSQRGCVLTGEAFVGRMHLQIGERLLCALPMFHVNALLYSLSGAIACGGTVIPVRRFSASAFWKTAAAAGATEVNLVGAMGHMLTARARSEFVPHTIRRVFVAPATREMVEVFRRDFGVDTIIECYGMSEIPGLLSNPVDGLRKVASLGIVSPHPDPAIARPEVRVVDDEGNDVVRGQIGELVARTPTIMQGYLGNPEQTADAFRDGWFRTGDLVYQDEDGYFFLVTRRNDVIRRRGEMISGAELDRVLSTHPDVLEAAAIPVPSDLGEEDILVAVVRRPGAHPPAEDLAAWMRRHLGPAKAPQYVAFVESLPHTATGRLEKYKLRADAALRASATDLRPDRVKTGA